jgi:hypothetical protein
VHETGIGYADECFFIAPIGAVGTDVRSRSDGIRDFVVRPAVAELGLHVLRADDLHEPGQITTQVIEHVLNARAAVADLTGANANVYYELAVRHAARLPVVLIADEDEIDRLPFDIAAMRVIGFSHRDLASAARAKEQIGRHLVQGMSGAVDSPVASALSLDALSQGSGLEQAIGDLVARVDALAATNSQMLRLMRAPEAVFKDVTHPHERDRKYGSLDAGDTSVHYSVTERDGDWLTAITDPRTGITHKFSTVASPTEEDVRSMYWHARGKETPTIEMDQVPPT